ncbi:hypothetical protein LWI29_031515 [Acer saccharum]|uniref:Uncharacterized protein n=1 Tax=Acer saccharum TaxID=4024 RepID=A0AA39VP94_ACESA|nr:hypothetical protein LWI29_031515 [Acer saccharum]
MLSSVKSQVNCAFFSNSNSWFFVFAAVHHTFNCNDCFSAHPNGCYLAAYNPCRWISGSEHDSFKNSSFLQAKRVVIPATILKLPLSCLDAFVWTSLTYHVIGYSPQVER